MEASVATGLARRRESSTLAARLEALPRFTLRCADCGYGVVVRMAPERCPMCQGSVWEHSSREYLALR